jgi:serine/threonine protein kinase
MGHGSYAHVWLSFDIINKEYCATKIHNSEDYKHGLRESKVYSMIKELHSPYLMAQITNFDYNDNDDESSDDMSEPADDELYHCCIMELMQGSIYDLLNTEKYKKGLPIDFILKCIHQILSGLSVMHDNKYIHADIKPENILVSGISEKYKVLIDKLDLITLINNIKKQKSNGKIKNNKKNKNKKKQLDQDTMSSDDLKKILDHCRKTLESLNLNNDDTSDDKSDSDIDSVNDSQYLTSDTDDSSQLSIGSFMTEVKNTVDTLLCPLNVDTENDLIDKNIKISDMGTCVHPLRSRFNKRIQTVYYRSPEILMDLGYSTKSDIWALGCTIYEMLTGEILFDAEDCDENKARHAIMLIVQRLGMIPEKMINKSPQKNLFFSVDQKRIRGYNSFDEHGSLYKCILDVCIFKGITRGKTLLLLNLVTRMLSLDPEDRISASDALKLMSQNIGHDECENQIGN